jgi:hypothetical protein
MLRKISYVALLLLIGLGSCRKKQFEELKQTNNKDAKAIEQSSVWFDDQKLASLKPLSTARGTTIDSIPFHPVWEVAVTHQLADNNKLVLAPVWRYANVQYANQRGFLRLLVVKLNSSDEIIAGNIVEIMAEKSYLKQNQQDIMKWYFEGNMRDFTGDILFHALTRNLEFQMGKRYVNGQFVSEVKIYKVAPESTNAGQRTDCPNPPCDAGGDGESQTHGGELIMIPIPTMDGIISGVAAAAALANGTAQSVATASTTNNTGGISSGYDPSAMPNNYLWFYGNNWGGIGGTTNPNDGGQPITGIDYGMPIGENPIEDARVLEQLNKVTRSFGIPGHDSQNIPSDKQKLNLAYTLDAIINSHYVYRNLYNELIERNVKICWFFEPNMRSRGRTSVIKTGEGEYLYKIALNLSGFSTKSTVEEEMIHALQHSRRPSHEETITEQERGCMEFEAKMIMQIVAKNGAGGKYTTDTFFDNPMKYKETDINRYNAINGFRDNVNDFLKDFAKGKPLPQKKEDMKWHWFINLLPDFHLYGPTEYNLTNQPSNSNIWNWETMFILFKK